MSTIALKGRNYIKDKRNVSLKERIANVFKAYVEETGVMIACGRLAMTGNASAFDIMYQMLRK